MIISTLKKNSKKRKDFKTQLYYSSQWQYGFLVLIFHTSQLEKTCGNVVDGVLINNFNTISVNL